MIVKAQQRCGFTLLEVMLASVIALLLLGALYVSFDVTLRQGDAARDAVASGQLASALTNRMTIDLACCIGPMPPKSGGGIPEDPSATAPATTAAATTGTTTGAAAPAATGTASTATSAETAVGVAAGSTDLAASEGVIAADLPFQGGLFGTDRQVTLFVSGVPPALSNPETADPQPGAAVDPRADLRRVTYYLSGKGLCRQVRPWVTAEGVRNSADPEDANDDADLIAEEVKDVTFEYFDGSAWQTSWTGSETAGDGGSVKGPPRAIRITMAIEQPGRNPRTIAHVISVRAAVGLAVPPPLPEEEVVDPATTGM